MILINRNGLKFFTFSNLAAFDGIRHGVFTRSNSNSNNAHGQFNVGLSSGDDKKNVLQNRALIAECMDGADLVFSNQVHDTGVLILDRNNPKIPAHKAVSPMTGDAMVTDIRGKLVAIQQADCQAVLIYDPQKNVVANIHAGWRGTVKNIIGACIKSMRHNFDCDPQHMVAAISPSLGPCCSEFVNYKTEIPEKYWHYKDKYDHFNLWAMTFDQLLAAGFQSDHIELSHMCTKCNDHLFFSYRNTPRTGRFVSVIGLK